MLIIIIIMFNNVYCQLSDEIIFKTNKKIYVGGDSILFSAIFLSNIGDLSKRKQLKLEILDEKDSIIQFSTYKFVNGVCNGIMLVDKEINM